MAWYLIALMGLTVIVSIKYEKLAFCSYFCPVGKMLGLYALLAKWGIRDKSQDTCTQYTTKECITIGRNYKVIGRSCTSNLYVAKIQNNSDYILCTQCIKAFPNDNIEIKKVIQTSNTSLSSAEVGMITLLMGFVSYEILSSWKIYKIFLLSPFEYLYTTDIATIVPKGTFSVICLFVLFPSNILLAVALIDSKFAKKKLFIIHKRFSLNDLTTYCICPCI